MDQPPASSIQGTGAVRPSSPRPLVAEHVPAPAEPPRRPVPGVDAFDSAEVLASATPRTYAQLAVHHPTGEVTIKIMDAQTDEVIRQIPPDAVLKIAEQLQAYLEAQQKRRG